MVLYKIDGNYIDAKPMQDSKDNSLVKAYNTLWVHMTKSGKVKPTVHILDNKASAHFKEEIRKIVTYSWSLRIHTGKILPSALSKPSKVISLPFWQDWTRHFS
jgi:hypothetical protein